MIAKAMIYTLIMMLNTSLLKKYNPIWIQIANTQANTSKMFSNCLDDDFVDEAVDEAVVDEAVDEDGEAAVLVEAPILYN
jgi:hypothetical protein